MCSLLTYEIIQGFAIGNGLTDPAIQYAAYADYALDAGLIKQTEHDRINKVLPLCETAVKLCGNFLTSILQHVFYLVTFAYMLFGCLLPSMVSAKEDCMFLQAVLVISRMNYWLFYFLILALAKAACLICFRH